MPEAQQPQWQVAAIIESVLKLHRIRYDRDYLSDRVLSHPDYPSLRGVSEILGEYGVQATWYEGEVADVKASLHPCILLMKDGTLRIVPLIQQGRSRLRASLEALAPQWSGCFLQCAVTEHAREYRWGNGRVAGQRQFSLIVGSLPVVWAVLSILALVSACLGANRAYWLPSFLLAAALLGGAAVCLLLTMKRRFRIELPLCGAGRAGGCAKVMDSPAGSMAGIPLADFGLVLFLGGLMALKGAMGHPALYRCALIPFALALPISIYLVLYQKFVLKSWCVYCLLVQAVVWIVAALLLWLQRVAPPFPFALGDMARIAFYFVIATGLVVALEHFIYPYYARDEARLALNRLLQAPAFIDSRVQSGKKVDLCGLDEICTFGSGSGSGSASLTIVASPSCMPCKTALLDAFRVLKASNHALTLNIRFLVFEGDPTPPGEVAEYLATLQVLLDQGEAAKAEKAFREWFIERSVLGEQWFASYGKAEADHIGRARETLRASITWCEGSDIEATPAIILNGSILQHPMKVQHLVYWALRLGEG